MNGDDVLLRREQSHDESGVRAVNEAAFGRSDEADLVDRLRHEGAVLASFVAEQERDIIGHILFSRALRSGSCASSLRAPRREDLDED